MVIGKYIRLSQADRDVMKKGDKAESESIAHQRDLIQRYINLHSDLKGCEVREFYDDGYSGTNFRRPSFERLLEQIKKGEIGCVIVKDFSRFGRDYIELGDYLERIFPFLGVRFISVNDGYDSNDFKGTTGGLDVVLKNIVYDFYSKDLSVKVRTAKRAKMRRGEYIGGHVPYGLKKHPSIKGKLEIDEEAASVVREIFDLFLGDMKVVDIARELNRRGCETPAAYYRRKYPESKKFADVSEYNCWDVNNVRKILTQEMYYGAVAGHKREAVVVGGKQTKAVPKEEQLIVENMHPGIITKDEFVRVQEKIRRKKKPVRETKPYLLKSKVVCGYCGSNMRRVWNNIRERWHYGYWKCDRKAYFSDAECVKYVRDEVLETAVWNAIRGMMCLTDNARGRMNIQSEIQNGESIRLAKELAELQRMLEKCRSDKFVNVDGFMAGWIGEEEYQRKREELTEESGKLEEKIREADERLKAAERMKNTEILMTLDVLDRFSGETGLTAEMADALVKKVTVYAKDRVEIEWDFSEDVYGFIMGE